ncbi:hypothetical protein IMSAGC012_01825 [Lachnospiraceae bacterium]|nr:hypothetical protein IMSAGC012_01825 [Lachnospiraceae bacterium]
MNNETTKTEQLIQIYKEDSVKENLKALMHQMKKTSFFVPAIFPDTPEVLELKQQMKERPGQQIKLPKGVSPIPAVLNNQKGDKFLPVYSSPEQIPQEPRFDLLMNMPFHACCSLAMDARLQTQGMVLNPFTDNLSFKKELLEAVLAEGAAPAAAKQVKLTSQQYQVMMRQKAEFHDFPLRAFREGSDFIYRLSDEGGTVVDEVYRQAYEKKELYPYQESDFDVMALNIRENLLLVRVDLPKPEEKTQLCRRIYITLQDEQKVQYFTIERGKKKKERYLGGVDAEGKHIAYGEAPVESAEIQRILDLTEQRDGTS